MNWEKRNFSIKCPFNNWSATLKKIKLDTYLIPYVKIKSQQTKYLNVKKKRQNYKTCRKNMRISLCQISCKKHKAQEI